MGEGGYGISWWKVFLTTELVALISSVKKLGSCKCLEPSEFESSHLVNSDSREGITIRNLMLTDLMSWLPGNRPDTFLDPDQPHYFVHDHSQREPRKYTNVTKREENTVVDVLNEAVSLATFSSYFNVNKYLIPVHLEQGSFFYSDLIQQLCTS